MTVFTLCLAIALSALAAGGLLLRLASQRVDTILAEELAPRPESAVDLVEHR
jgi:hypothetical protein